MSTAAAVSSAPSRSRGLHIALWIVQILIGGLFTMAGFAKGFQPMEMLATRIPWTTDVGVAMTRFIGISELLGGIGLVLPAATRIFPKLTAAAGAGLALVMVLAAGFHATRGEFAAVPINLALGGLAAFVTWGRLLKAPIEPR